jgi:glycosyltransferase involved in cell wall biosynthesis
VGVVASTSPPLCSVAALIIHWIRGVPLKFWWMDMNPDQAIALGVVSERSWGAWCFEWLNRRILAAASDVVALDRFMADRLVAKGGERQKITILPPWPHVDVVDTVDPQENPFCQSHGLNDKFVVMYSGNHSIASPLTTLVEAALRLQDHRRLHFMFIGGGLGKQEVEQAIERHRPTNIVSLPYQPLDQLRYSLSAANVHVVALGDNMVGMIHPCKIYGAMAVGRPVLFLGPRPSHVSDLLDEYQIGWHVAHGDVDGAVAALELAAATSPEEIAAMGQRAQDAVRTKLSKQILAEQFCDVIQRGLADSQPATRKRESASHAAVTK